METPELKKCTKCQSEKIMYPVFVNGDIQTPIPIQLKIKAPKDAGNWLDIRFSDRFMVNAAVCGNCGNVELYAEKPNQIWEKWQAGYR